MIRLAIASAIIAIGIVAGVVFFFGDRCASYIVRDGLAFCAEDAQP